VGAGQQAWLTQREKSGSGMPVEERSEEGKEQEEEPWEVDLESALMSAEVAEGSAVAPVAQPRERHNQSLLPSAYREPKTKPAEPEGASVQEVSRE
jgi:hypothetical protein